MNITITCHIMPWEIDYALLTFTQLKKSKYYLPQGINIIIKSALNLSNYLIDWDNSKIPQEYFIQKYKTLSLLLKDYNHIPFIYQGNKLWGHLDLQNSVVSQETDYYINICPDVYFSEHLLYYITQAVNSIPNKYFIVTPQIGKFWDSSWDIITNPLYLNQKSEDWDKTDVFDIIHKNKYDNEKRINPIEGYKYAGWFDLYSKKFYEELCPFFPEWNGYGGWDLYSLIVTNYAKQSGVDVQQYIIQGETIFEYSVGPLYGKNRDGFSSYYKDMLTLKDYSANNQRQNFENTVNKYVNTTLSNLKEKNII